MAMLDVSDFALALARSASVDEAIHAYETTMLPRATDIAKMLEGHAEGLLSTDIPDFGDDHDTQP